MSKLDADGLLMERMGILRARTQDITVRIERINFLTQIQEGGDAFLQKANPDGDPWPIDAYDMEQKRKYAAQFLKFSDGQYEKELGKILNELEDYLVPLEKEIGKIDYGRVFLEIKKEISEYCLPLTQEEISNRAAQMTDVYYDQASEQQARDLILNERKTAIKTLKWLESVMIEEHKAAQTQELHDTVQPHLDIAPSRPPHKM